MQTSAEKLDVVLVGGGMITHDQILPSLYHLQRLGRIGGIKICALNSAPLAALAHSERLVEAFPQQSFEPLPSLAEPPDRFFPDLFREVIAQLPPKNLVVVAVPDHMHAMVIQEALERDQHVLCVKPLVPTYQQATVIEQMAHQRGLLVAVEYHKRFDRRALDARGQYRKGRFGQFRLGEARLIEPYYYRHSNFQNWFTKENTDPFTYVGCHYVDLVYFITGLRPVEVSVRGVEGRFPNGNIGWLWSAGTVIWENGAAMTLLNGLGYPDAGAGTNDQGLTMYCEGPDCGALLHHDDQYRGVSHSYIDLQSGAMFRYVSPDFLRLVPWEGDGLRPVGYGYESICAIVEAAIRVNSASAGLEGEAALEARQIVLQEIDQRGILATPANSSINELVTGAVRMSIAADGRWVEILYDPKPHIQWKAS